MKIDELNASLNVSRITPLGDKIISIANEKNTLEYGYIYIYAPNQNKFEVGEICSKNLSIEFLEDVIKVMKENMSDQDVKLAEGGK